VRNCLTAGARLLSRSKLRTSLRPRSPSVLNEPTEPLYPNFTPLSGGWVNFEFHRKRRRLSKCEASFAALRRFAHCCGLKAAVRPLLGSPTFKFNHTPPARVWLKAGEESFNGRSAAFKPQQAPNFAQAAK